MEISGSYHGVVEYAALHERVFGAINREWGYTVATLFAIPGNTTVLQNNPALVRSPQIIEHYIIRDNRSVRAEVSKPEAARGFILRSRGERRNESCSAQQSAQSPASGAVASPPHRKRSSIKRLLRARNNGTDSIYPIHSDRNRSERFGGGEGRRAATGAYTAVCEDREHCPTPPTNRAVDLCRYV